LASRVVDQNRVELGHGPKTFERSRLAIRSWKVFPMTAVILCGSGILCGPEARTEPGTTLAVLASDFGFGSLNAGRIVRLIDEPRAIETKGFA
jgi:uncharacterized protein (UPF0548 family)